MKLNRQPVGDTIIEVLLSATALALVLSVSFISANRSLRSGTEAANRNQAVQYASQQVELLRLGLNSGSLIAKGAGTNIPPGNFCVLLDASNKPYPNASASPCNVGVGIFGVTDKYDNSNQTFTITTLWQSSLTGNNNQVIMYYQDPQ